MEMANKGMAGGTKTTGGDSGEGAGAVIEPVLVTRDFMVSGEEFALFRAGDNGLLRTDPVPANLSAYYQSDAYISHTDHRKTLFEKLYQGFKVLNLAGKIRLLNRLMARKGSLLDFGSGTGDFLVAAHRAGWKAFGVEPNAGARSMASQKGVRAEAELEALPGDSFDIITLWHVLEHLPEPGTIIQRLGARLYGHGLMIVAVPNHRAFDAKFYGSFWAAYDTPRHLWHFTKPSLENLFKEQGFDLMREKAMWLDAYYVSWLSEKYRKNPLAPLRAFLVASISNILAIFNGESSSRIYIFKKSSSGSEAG